MARLEATWDGRAMRPTSRTLALAAVLLGGFPAVAGAQDSRPLYRVYALGDSYASGEGAPGTPGSYDGGGDNPSPRAIWSGTPAQRTLYSDVEGGDMGAQRCHRSPRATAAVAVERLKLQLPRVDFRFRSFACSGAKVDIGVLQSYSGIEKPDRGEADENDRVVDAQVEQLTAAHPEGRPLHALVMNIGGNNLGFGKIIGNCVELPVGSDPCSPPEFHPEGKGSRDTERLFEFGEGEDELGLIGRNKLPGLFARLGKSLSGGPVGQPGDSNLGPLPRTTIVTGPPNLLGGGTAGCRARQDFYSAEKALSAPEQAWIDAVVYPRFVSGIRDGVTSMADATRSGNGGAALDAEFVDMSGAFADGLCVNGGRINGNTAALRSQGYYKNFTGALRISAGFVHPTADGFSDMANVLVPRLRAKVEREFTPAGTRLVTPVDKRALGGGVVLEADNSSGSAFAIPAGRAAASDPWRTRNSNTPNSTVDFVPPTGDIVPIRAKACAFPVNTAGTTDPVGCNAERTLDLRVGTPGTATLSSAVGPRDGLVSIRFQKSAGGPTLRRFVVKVQRPTFEGASADPACGMAQPGQTQPGGTNQSSGPSGQCITPSHTPAPTEIPLDGDLTSANVPAGKDDTISIRECTDRGCGPYSAGRKPTPAPTFPTTTQVQRDPGGITLARYPSTVDRSARRSLYVGWRAWKGWKNLRSIDVQVVDAAGALATFALDPKSGRVTFRGRGGKTSKVIARFQGKRRPKGTRRSGGVTLDARGVRMVRVPSTAVFDLPLTLGSRAVQGEARIVMRATTKSGFRQRPLTAATFTIG